MLRRAAQRIGELVDRLQDDPTPVVHPQQILDALHRERSRVSRFNGWLADHIVALIGTMICAYLFCALTLTSLPEALRSGNVLVIVQWVAQTFLQLVLLPVILVAQNRSTERDQIKDEADHRAQRHLYEVNDEQLAILRQIKERNR